LVEQAIYAEEVAKAEAPEPLGFSGEQLSLDQAVEHLLVQPQLADAARVNAARDQAEGRVVFFGIETGAFDLDGAFLLEACSRTVAASAEL